MVMLLCVLCTACRNTNETKSNKQKTIDERIWDIGSEILEGYKNKDKNKILSVFTTNQRVYYEADIEKNIEESFEFINGNIIDYKDIIGSSGGGKIENGEYVLRLGDGSIRDIRTDSDDVYEIYYSICLIDQNDENNVGVSYILITDIGGKGQKFEIGR